MGFLDNIKTRSFEYNPDKFWKENTIESIFRELEKNHYDRLKRQQENNWKPEYFISARQAKTDNLFHLQWLSKNYHLIGGLEAVTAIIWRKVIINFKIK